jgi:hypothetical protein
MILSELLPPIAREIKKRTIYRKSGGLPTPSSRSSDLLHMVLDSMPDNTTLNPEFKKPIRIDYGLHTIDEAPAFVSSGESSTRIGIYAISGRSLEILPTSIIIASTDLIVVAPEVDPVLYPEGYLTSTKNILEHPDDWINKYKDQTNVLDMSLIFARGDVPRTKQEQFRRALMELGLF